MTLLQAAILAFGVGWFAGSRLAFWDQSELRKEMGRMLRITLDVEKRLRVQLRAAGIKPYDEAE